MLEGKRIVMLVEEDFEVSLCLHGRVGDQQTVMHPLTIALQSSFVNYLKMDYQDILPIAIFVVVDDQ